MPTNRSKYNYSWGRGVVNAFVEKHARATYNFARITDISPGEVRHYLVLILCSGNHLKFDTIKRVIKNLGDYRPGDISRIPPEDRILLYKCLRTDAENHVLDEKKGDQALDRYQNKVLEF